MNKSNSTVTETRRRGGYRRFKKPSNHPLCAGVTQRVEQAISESGQTLAEFAEASGMTEPALRNRLEFQNFYLPELMAIAQHLGSKASILFEEIK